ncbi:hypothetical protein WK53_12730 [Burkholderia ubonensis]|uniref:Uncharacterized protein n=1 Tax=Burkholderia ubonensis TaxID=101571 RepID=A0AAW3N9A7_9BURK|nr:hypothetical protein WK53_12730 [Burkholderia ubonensis]
MPPHARDGEPILTLAPSFFHGIRPCTFYQFRQQRGVRATAIPHFVEQFVQIHNLGLLRMCIFREFDFKKCTQPKCILASAADAFMQKAASSIKIHAASPR